MTFCKLLNPLEVTLCHGLHSGIVTAAEILRKRLLERGIRPRDLAKALDVDASMASLMLRGERNIAVWHLDAIATLLEMSVPALFGEDVRAAGTEPRDLSRHLGMDDESGDRHPRLGGRPDGLSAARALAKVSSEYFRFVTDVAKQTRTLAEFAEQQAARLQADRPRTPRGRTTRTRAR